MADVATVTTPSIMYVPVMVKDRVMTLPTAADMNVDLKTVRAALSVISFANSHQPNLLLVNPNECRPLLRALCFAVFPLCHPHVDWIASLELAAKERVLQRKIRVELL